MLWEVPEASLKGGSFGGRVGVTHCLLESQHLGGEGKEEKEEEEERKKKKKKFKKKKKGKRGRGRERED